MIFKGKEINADLFKLSDDKLNPQGLYEYALNIGVNLGVEYGFMVKTNGEQYETAEYLPSANIVIIPGRFVADNLTEKEYRATKGAIDHEACHILWLDRSYFSDDKNDNEKMLVWDIGNMIDDIRIEHRLVNEFQVDKDNFRFLAESFYNNMSESDLDEFFQSVVGILAFLVNVRYREIDSSLLGNRKIPGKMVYLEPKIFSIIDRFIESDEKGGDTAKEIIELLRHESPEGL